MGHSLRVGLMGRKTLGSFRVKIDCTALGRTSGLPWTARQFGPNPPRPVCNMRGSWFSPRCARHQAGRTNGSGHPHARRRFRDTSNTDWDRRRIPERTKHWSATKASSHARSLKPAVPNRHTLRASGPCLSKTSFYSPICI